MRTTIISTLLYLAILGATSCWAEEPIQTADMDVRITNGLDEKVIADPPIIQFTEASVSNKDEVKNILAIRGFYPTPELKDYLQYITEAARETGTVAEGRMLFPEVSKLEKGKIPDGFYLKITLYPEEKARIASQILEFENILGRGDSSLDPIIRNMLVLHNKIIDNQIFLSPGFLDELIAQVDLLFLLVEKQQSGKATDEDTRRIELLKNAAESRVENLWESLSTTARTILPTRKVKVFVRTSDGELVPNARIYMKGQINYEMNSGNPTKFGVSKDGVRERVINCGNWYFWVEKAGSMQMWIPELINITKQGDDEDLIQVLDLLSINPSIDRRSK